MGIQPLQGRSFHRFAHFSLWIFSMNEIWSFSTEKGYKADNILIIQPKIYNHEKFRKISKS